MIIFEQKAKYAKYFFRYFFSNLILFSSFQVTGQAICQGDADDLSINDLSLTWSSASQTANSHGQPIVADLDSDGIPEVIVTNKENSTLNILDGIGDGTGFTNYDGIVSSAAIDLGFTPYNTVAVADIAVGSHASIVVAGYEGSLATPDHKLSLWSFNGTTMEESWKIDIESVTGSNKFPGTVGIADFGDGTARIYFANVILNADGTLYAKGTDTDWPVTIGHGSLALDVLGDANLELITGGKIWSVTAPNLTLAQDINGVIDRDGSIVGDYYIKTWSNAGIIESRVMISAADYDLDGDIDLIFPGALGSSGTDATAVFLWDPTDSLIDVFKPTNNHTRGTGRIAIGDTDGDGEMNALFVSGNSLYNLDENLQQQWIFTVTEGDGSGYGGVTLYDFNGDGKSEILFRDREFFKTFRDLGTTAQTILEAPCKSFTMEEYPLVADVNNDGQAEICFSCLADDAIDATDNDLETVNTPLGNIRVYGASSGSRWQPTRGVWNQHAYLNVNIDDDLSVPTSQNLLSTASADCYSVITGSQNKPLNMFMSQAPLRGTNGCPSFVLPDLTIGSLSATTAGCPDTDLDLTFTITNEGDLTVSGILPVTFYSKDPTNASATKLNTSTVQISSMAKNESATFTKTVTGLGTNNFDWDNENLYVVVNESGAIPPISYAASLIPECDVSNNVASLNVDYSNFQLSPDTTIASVLTLIKVSDNNKCDDTKPNNGEVQVYYDGSIGGSIETIYNENFEDNSISNLNSTNLSDPSRNWSASGGNASAITDRWGVGAGRQTSGKTFIVNNGTNTVILESKSIDITSYTGIAIDIDAYTNNTLEVSGAGQDKVEVFYSIDDNAYVKISTGTSLIGSFSYQHINQGGLSGSTLRVKVEITNNDVSEYTEIDNITITGFSPAVNTEHTESSGFEFLWYPGDVASQGADFTNNSVVHTGSTFTGMAEGTYTVRGRYLDGNCFSDALDVEIDKTEIAGFSLTGWEAAPLTDCLTPDGIAQAGVGLDSSITTNYDFTWYLSSEGVTPLGKGVQLTNRTDGAYKLVGVSTITGCSQTKDNINITTAQTLPDQPTITVTNVLSCDDPNTGQLVASIPPDGNDYRFRWSFGRLAKPTADYNQDISVVGDTYANIPVGPYTVVTVNTITGCESRQLVTEVGPPDNYPTPELILNNENTSCAGNGQITARFGDGSSDWDLSAHSFEFFNANNTLVASKLGSVGVAGSSTDNVASGLLDRLHTVKVTHIASGCTATDTITVPENISLPEFNFSQVNEDVDNNNVIDRCESTTNLALAGTASGSSTANGVDLPSFVNDGTLSGHFNSGTSNTIDGEAVQKTNEWVEIDLGAVSNISDILIWPSRHCGSCLGRIENVEVMVSSEPFTDASGNPLGRDVVGYNAARENSSYIYNIGNDYNNVATNAFESIVTIEAETSGRYIRVQKSGTNPNGNTLNIVEIQVFEACNDGIEAAIIHKSSCSGANNGAIDLTDLVDPTSGTTYNYSLYDGNDTSSPSANVTGATSGIFTGLDAGTYTVVAEEQNGSCSTSQRVLTILEKEDKPFLQNTYIHDSGCTDRGTGAVFDITAKMMASDEPSSYTFELFSSTDNSFLEADRVGAAETITDGSAGFSFGSLTDGTYTLRVTNDDIGCATVEYVIIDDISVNPIIDTDELTDNTGCNPYNGTVFISEVDGNTGTDLQDNYSFSWVSSDGTDVTPASNTNVPSSLIGDTYTVTVTSTITGCTVDKDYVITDNAIYPSLAVSQIRPNTACVINQGTGMHFDGSNDWIALPQKYTNPLTSFTAECWFKTDDNRGSEFSNWALIDFDRSEYYNVFVRQDGRLGFSSRQGRSWRDLVGSTANLNDGRWHHVAAVYDGTDKIIYLDGVENARHVNAHGGQGIGLGKLDRYGFLGDGSEANSFNGRRNRHIYGGAIDEVRIWNTARTPAEIQENMNQVVAPSSAGLWAYYRLDEGVSETNNTMLGNTIIDSGPNGFNGTLFNSAKNGPISNWVEGTIVTEALGDGIGSAVVTEDGIIYDGSSDNFNFAWYGEDPATNAGTPIIRNIGRPIDLGNADYWIQATNAATSCQSTVRQVTIGHTPTKPVISLNDSSSNTSCDPSNWTGSITVDVTLFGVDENEDDYTFFWDVDLPTNIPNYTSLGEYTEDGETHRYFLYRGGIEEWQNARDRAETQGGYMYIPDSWAENVWVADKVNRNGGGRAWIGLNDIVIDGEWEDVLGNPLGVGAGGGFIADPSIDLSKWPRGNRLAWSGGNEPNNAGDEDYAHFWYNSPRQYWNDIGGTNVNHGRQYLVLEMPLPSGSTNKLDSIPAGNYTVTTVGPNGCESDPFSLEIHDDLPVIDVGFRYQLNETICDASKNGTYSDKNGGITIFPTIDEVGVTNWALPANGGRISMSSTVVGKEGRYAIDDDTDGAYDIDSVDIAETEGTSDYDYIDIILSSSKSISDIVIWNVEDMHSRRLENVQVMISNSPFPTGTTLADFDAAKANSLTIGGRAGGLNLGDLGPVVNTNVPNPEQTLGISRSNYRNAQVEINQSAQYVRIQKSGTNPGGNKLSIAEIQVYDTERNFEFEVQTFGGVVLDARGMTAGYDKVRYKTRGPITTVTGLPAGSYRVNLTDAAVSLCSNLYPEVGSFQIQSNNDDKPVIDAVAMQAAHTANTSCATPNGTADATEFVRGGYGSFDYSWTYAGTVVGTDGLLSGVEGGNYGLTVTDRLTGCQESTSITIDDDAAIVAAVESNLQHNTVCDPNENDPAEPDANGSVTFNPTTDGSSTGNYTFSLSTSAGAVTTTNAIGLDGINDYMTTDLQLNNMAEITMEGWVYPYVGGSRKGFFGQNDNFEFGFNGSNQIVCWSSVGHNLSWTFNSTSFPFSEWHHVALVKTTSNIKMFIDGVERATRNNSRTLASSSFKFNVGGAVWDAGGNHVKQKFDDVRVWNVAKTQAELQAGMNSELVGNEAGLIGYWKFDEGAAGGDNTALPSSIEDSSPNDNVGTLIASAKSGSSSNWLEGKIQQSVDPSIPATGGDEQYSDVRYTGSGASTTVTGLPEGDYVMTVTDAVSGCTDEYNFTILDQPNVNLTSFDLITSITTTPDTQCNGDNGSISLNFNALNVAPVLGSGSYTVKYYEGNSVTAPAAGDTSMSANGVAFANLAGNGDGASDGVYTVVVFDNETGCATMARTLTIGFEPDRPNFTPVATGDASSPTRDNSVCDITLTGGTYNGQITINPDIAGTEASYTYEWFDGTGTATPTTYSATDNVLTNVPSGTYTLKITSILNNCDTTINFTVNNDFTPMPLTETITDMSVCEGNVLYPNGGIDIVVGGGSGNYTYKWFYGSGADNTKQLNSTATIFNQKGTTGVSAQNVSGATSANISFINGNGNPGTMQYTIQVLDTDRGCYQTGTYAVGVEDPGLSVTAEVLKDNFSCDASNPTGSVGISSSVGAVTPQFEWYVGVGTGGSRVGVTATVEDLADGIYTVKYIDGSTNCFVTDQVTVGDYTPTVSASSTSNTAQTQCNPANGTATVVPAISFINNTNSAAENPDDGWTTGDYTYQWYLGVDLSTPLANGVDPGNGSTPADVTLATATGLAEDNYTVEITETNSGCTQQVLVTVADGISAGAPDLAFQVEDLPASCLAVGEFSTRLASNPTGNTFAFEFYEGAQDHTLDAVGTGLATGDQLLGNPSQTITVVANNTATIAGTWSDNSIADVMSKPYTIVVTDQTTGCRYQEYFSLGYAGQQTTTTLTVENVDECPDNGVARVGLADYVDTTSVASIAATTGFNANQFDDISQYILYLYSGTGVPADQEAPYVVDGLTFPFLYDGSTGIVTDGDGNVLGGLQAGPGIRLNAGESAEFRGLPAGDYIAIAREKLNVAWQVGVTDRCWSAVSFDKELVDLAYAPILSAAPVITSNTNCDVTLADGGNGQLSITVKENPAENLNDAGDQQPAGYIFTWKNASNVTVKTETKKTETATSTTDANLVPGTYTVTIERALQVYNMTYAIVSGTFIAGEKINITAGGAGSGYIQNILSGTNVLFYPTSGTFNGGVTFEGVTSGAVGIQAAGPPALGPFDGNGCELVETIILDDDPELHVVNQSTTVDYNNCDALPASTITINDNDVLADGVGQNAADYTYQWFKAGTAAGNLIAGQTGRIIDLSALATADPSFIIADRYYVVASNISNGCITPSFEVDIIDNTSAPVVSITSSTADTSCKTGNQGDGSITFAVSAPQLNTDYTYQWYPGVDTSGTALTDGGTISGSSGTINGATNGSYTATITGLNTGSYTVHVVDAADPNHTCSTISTIYINEDITRPTLVASNIVLQDNQNCSTPNGYFEITSVSERGAPNRVLTAYSYAWFESDGTTPINGVLSDVGAGTDNRVDGLIGGTYYVEITNTTTECKEAVEFMIEDNSVNPIINLVSSTDDTYCSNAGFIGDGTITVAITDDGSAATLSDFSVEWYRGRLNQRTANATDSIEFLYDDAGTVPATGVAFGDPYDFSVTRGDAAVGANILTLTGLSEGDYTIYVRKNNGANDATGDNYDCETIVTYTVGKNSPFLSVKHPAFPGDLTSYTLVDNLNCNPLTGSLKVFEVLVDGANVNLNNASPYTINWLETGVGTITTSNAGVSIANDQLTALDSGTYTFNIENNNSKCITDTISVFVDSEVILPFLSVEVIKEDIVCDDVTYDPTGEAHANVLLRAGILPSANFSFTWYTDQAGTTLLTEPAGKTYFYDSLGNVVNNGDPGARVLKNVPEGIYYVKATDVVTPNFGCVSTPMQSVIIQQFESTIFIGSTPNTDFIIQHSNDCDPSNGSFELLKVSETRPLGEADFVSTTMTDYRFDWYESIYDEADTTAVNLLPLGTFTTTARFPSGATANSGTNGGNKVINLPEGRYFIKATNISTTGCGQSDTTMMQFNITEETVDPIVEFDTTTNTIDCLRPWNDGDATASINLPEDESRYSINWFRGDTVGVIYDSTWLFGSDVAAVNWRYDRDVYLYDSTIRNTRLRDLTTMSDTISDLGDTIVGTAAPNAGSYTSLVGLSEGFYTVLVTDKVTPGKGCYNTLTLQILNSEVIPFINIPEAQITDNMRCDEQGTGAILINSADITLTTGSSNVDDFNWLLTYDDGDSTTIGLDTIPVVTTGVGAASQIDIDSLNAGSYTFIATSKVTYCESEHTIDILGRGVAPVINDYTLTPDSDCAGTLRLGVIEILRIDSIGPITPNYSFQWYVGTDTLGTTVDITFGVDGTTSVLSSVPEGNYTVKVINTANGNCVSTHTMTIENEPIYPIVEDIFVYSNNICPQAGYAPGNGFFELGSIRYDGVPITDSTTLANNFTLEYTMTDYDTLTPLKIDSLGPGTYSLYVRSNDSQCRSEEVTTFIIEDTRVDPIIIFDQIQADSTCTTVSTLPNGALVATADGSSGPGFSFQWSLAGSNLGTNDTLSDLYADTYQLIVTDLITKCSTTSTYPLTNVPFEFNIIDYSTTDPDFCDPTNGIIDVREVDRISNRVGAAPLTYQFYEEDPNNGGIIVQDSIINTFTQGRANTNYFFQAKNTDYGCTTELVEIFLTDSLLVFPEISLALNDKGELNSWNQYSCDPARPTGRLSVAVDGVNENPNFTYVWTKKISSGSIEISQVLATTSSVADSITAGKYEVEVTNIITQCSDIATFTIGDEIQNPLVVGTSASSNINCINPNGQMGAMVLNIGDNRAYKTALDGYSYYWFEGLITETNPDVSLAMYTGMTVDSVEAGIYTVYAVDNSTNCFTSDPTAPSSIVEVEDESTLPDLEVNVVNDLTICDPTMADGFAEIIDSEDQIFMYTIAWYSGIDTTQSLPFQYGTFADSLLAGDYLALITNKITGCTQFETFNILDLTERVPAPNAVIISDRTHCEYGNGHATASVLGETELYEFTWYLEADPRTVSFTGNEIDQLDTATYRVVAQNLITTCYSEPTQITINNAISDPAYRVEVTNSLCNRTEDGSTNQFTGGASIVFEEYHTIDSISWINEQGEEINFGDPKAFVLGNAAPGKYTVYFKPENGCLYESDFTIDASITVYNGLSVNDDGNNDFFLIDCADLFESNNVKIFNIEGDLIYEADGYDNLNIRFEGYGNVGNSTDELPVGSYYYMVDKGDGSRISDGFLELVR